MSTNNFPTPPSEPFVQQHEVADPTNAERLMQAIPAKPELLSVLRRKHIVSFNHFDPELVLQLFRVAASLEAGVSDSKPSMVGKVMGANFLAGSPPETLLSFKSAWQGMGGSILDLGPAADDIVQSQRDIAEIAALNNNYCDFAVLSTSREAMLSQILKYSAVPVINAGDGSNEAPTQALADLYVILKWRPDLLEADVPTENRLRIGIFGNPSSTGTIRSLLLAFALFPRLIDRIVVMERVTSPFSTGQREALEQAGLRIATVTELYPHDTVRGINAELVPHLDVIYSHLQVQQTISRMDMLEFKNLFKPNLLLMSPRRQLPEFSTLVNDTQNNGFFAQAKAGVLLRAALMAMVMAD